MECWGVSVLLLLCTVYCLLHFSHTHEAVHAWSCSVYPVHSERKSVVGTLSAPSGIFRCSPVAFFGNSPPPKTRVYLLVFMRFNALKRTSVSDRGGEKA